MPSPCYGLSDSTARLVLLDIFSILKDSCADCEQEDTFIQCAPVPASAQFYSQVADARNNYWITLFLESCMSSYFCILNFTIIIIILFVNSGEVRHT